MRQLKILVKITNRSSVSLEKYFAEVSKNEMITAEEEVQLTKKIREGDNVALEKLVKANLRFVISVAKQYYNGGYNISLGDLISEGNIGLITAASKFDETRGFKFISYAVWWIRQAIISAISQNARLIRQPMNRVMTLNKINNRTSELEQRLEREPTSEEVAESLGLLENDVTLLKNSNSWPSSIDAPFQDGEHSSLLDVIEEKKSPNPENGMMLSSLHMDIKSVLNRLTTRESEVIQLSFGLNGRSTSSLGEIGDKLDLTRERVRQLKEGAIRKLKSDPRCTNILKPYLGM